MRLTEVAVPFQLLNDKQLTDSARMLWRYLRAIRKHQPRLTWAELRRATGMPQYRLKQHMINLDELRWIQFDPLGVREFECHAFWRGTRAFTIPVDLVLDRRVPHGAKWLWVQIPKRRFSQARGIAHIEVTAADLSIESIAALLRRHNVPLRAHLDDQRHLVDAIEAEAAKYRRWAERLGKRSSR